MANRLYHQRFAVREELKHSEQKKLVEQFDRVGIMPILYVLSDHLNKLSHPYADEATTELSELVNEFVSQLEREGY